MTGTAFGNHDLSWIRRNAPADGSVRVSDVTSRWACFGLWGPRARDVLAPLTPDPLDFGYMTMRELAVGDVPVRALRVTFTGELGWELYCPTEFGAGAVARAVGGRRAARARGRRLPGDRHAAPGEGLPRVGGRHHARRDAPRGGPGLLRQGRQGSSLGRDALADREPAKRLRCLVLDDPRSVALGNEPVRVDGEIVGRVTTGGYGYTVGRSIAYAYLPPGHDVGTAVEVDIFGQWVAGDGGGRAALRSPRGAGAGVGSPRHRGGPMDPRDVQSIPLFAGLSKDDQKVVAQYADEVDVDAGTVLAQEGRLAYEFFAISEGTAEVTLDGQPRGDARAGGLLRRDRAAGRRPPRGHASSRRAPMSLVVLTGSQLRAIDSRMPGVAERIRSAMAQRMAANRVASG